MNCGCWVPKIARRGAGAGWLRDPDAMVAMAKMVVERVSLPVTIKTRIGYGPEDRMPILYLARRLEDVGVRAITIHCRTAQMGHSGQADWSWAKKACDLGDAFGCYLLGGWTRDGRNGLAADPVAGRALLARGCVLGHHWACEESMAR